MSSSLLSSSKPVTCPICSKEVSARVINEHIDSSCTKHTGSSSEGSHSIAVTPTANRASEKKSGGFSSSPMASIFSQGSKKASSESHPSFFMTPGKRSAEEDGFSRPPPAKRNKLANLEAAAPLAERLRPDKLSEFVGQPHLTGPDSLLMKSLAGGAAGSIIFWGPPGCGKTTLARLIAKQTDAVFKELSATVVGINDVRVVLEEARNALALTGRKTILFLDEVHRFNKSQQDIFLPFIEQGHIQLFGATTENPSFKLTGALLSRCRVFVLERLTDDDIKTILVNAVKRAGGDAIPLTPSSDVHPPSTLETPQSSPSEAADFSCAPFPQLTSKILSTVTSLATGDARTAISLLDLVLKSPVDSDEKQLLAALKRSVSASYDRTGESRYDMISALHKSVRGSQGSAAMYWLARMLAAGEDPLYIARRMVVCSSEDIGLADKHALPLAMAALQACQTIGMPECRINLAHIVAYLSEAPKSTRAYEAYNRAEAAAKLDMTIPVPMQVRNAPTGLMKDLGYGKDYCYNPDYAHPVHNTYLPVQFEGEKFLREEGDMSGKLWDEEALSRWEYEANGGKEWEGRVAPHTVPYHTIYTIHTIIIAMPTLPADPRQAHEDGPFRVLVTGFGPFSHYEVNPSWRAVKPLHNTVIAADTSAPVIVDDQVVLTEHHFGGSRPVHISALEIPVSYEAVLAIVPGLHVRPPILPESARLLFPQPPSSGYDFIFHIGVAGRGPLRMERQGHKVGYHMKDADGKLAHVVRSSPKDFSRRAEDTLAAENIERERLGMEIIETVGDTAIRPTRGFGAAYDNFPEEMTTEVDVTRLVQDLKRSGIEQIYTSMDAGHYLCDFIYYCSLAEAKRSAKPYEKRRNTQVLFLHCPPVNQPLSTEEVTEAIKRIIVWTCREIEFQDETDAAQV
ncbi:ATPase WRNIP1 C26H5.02c [Hypsizygus marmoreus]|uniref:ATPase WRNIP1 C26H5.02c n=1 Tax=Hypsizygus marmoreus TaxID=39966 RepID=A0A369J3V7_HYPMA|nr:ATPase WRNIP1 C26H5.02c [Hypsizygus marmoreus]